MEKTEIVTPITTTFTGSNYNLWVQGMKSFLISRKLWRILTADIAKPIREDKETATKFVDLLEDWDSKNHHIITWLRNTSVPYIHIQFSKYDSAKETPLLLLMIIIVILLLQPFMNPLLIVKQILTPFGSKLWLKKFKL